MEQTNLFGDGGLAMTWEVLLAPAASRPIHSMVQGADGRWYLTDELNHRLVIVEPDGTRRQVGGPGYGVGEFLHPRGLALITHPETGATRLYVCDAGNHRIQTLTLDGEAEGAFGGFGAGPGQFNAPSDVLVASPRVGVGRGDDETSAAGDPMLVVADERNNRVQVFDLNGVFIAAIGAPDESSAGGRTRPLSRKGWPYFRVGGDPRLMHPSRLAWRGTSLEVTCREGAVHVDLALALLPDFATWRREAERRLAASGSVVVFHSRSRAAAAPLPVARLSSAGVVSASRTLTPAVERLVPHLAVRKPQTAARAMPAAGRGVAFARPTIGAGEIDEVVATLESGWLTTGPRVKRFEERFAALVGAPYAVAVNSCSAALHLSLVAAGIGPGDEVITTPLTFCATANAIMHAGATPVFADIDPGTMNLDPEAARAAVTPRTRAVLPVHFGGRPADVLAIGRLARRHGLIVIEDAAHAVEAVAAGRRIGTTADFTCFSFYATKNLTTGEGGMVTTASAEAAGRMRTAALHGLSRDAWRRYETGGLAHYDVVMAGFKYNMMDLQAAIGLRQLDRLDGMHDRRESICRRYDEGLSDLPLTRPALPDLGMVHARHLYTVLVDETRCGWSRDALQAALAEAGIGTAIHFTALHLHSYYRDRFGLVRGQFPQAEFISDRTLSLPLSASLTDGEVDQVIEAVRRLMRKGPAGRVFPTVVVRHGNQNPLRQRRQRMGVGPMRTK